MGTSINNYTSAHHDWPVSLTGERIDPADTGLPVARLLELLVSIGGSLINADDSGFLVELMDSISRDYLQSAP